MTAVKGVAWTSTRHRSAPVVASTAIRPVSPVPATTSPSSAANANESTGAGTSTRHCSAPVSAARPTSAGGPGDHDVSRREQPQRAAVAVDGRRPQRRPRDDVGRPDLARRAGNREDPRPARRPSHNVRPQARPATAPPPWPRPPPALSGRRAARRRGLGWGRSRWGPSSRPSTPRSRQGVRRDPAERRRRRRRRSAPHDGEQREHRQRRQPTTPHTSGDHAEPDRDGTTATSRASHRQRRRCLVLDAGSAGRAPPRCRMSRIMT